MIYGGRIFAWTAGNLGSSEGLDVLMVLIGFFGPYFFLPKAFKWGGTLLATASTAINSSWPVKKSREVAGKELMATQKRKQNELVDKYYQGTVPGEELGKVGRRDRIRAGLKRGFVRTAGGHPIPTARSTWVMMQESGKWKQEEIALLEGKINNDYKEYQKNGLSVEEAKKRTRDKHYDPSGKNAFGNRAFFTWAYDNKSFLEMGEPDWRTGEGSYPDMVKTQGWIDFLHGNPQAYSDFGQRLGAFVPYRLPLGGGPKAEDYLPGGKAYFAEGPVTADGRRPVSAFATNDPAAAELLADSARFGKTIVQAEDPSAIPALRPEHFKELATITTELRRNSLPTQGADELKAFIEEQSRTLAGRNLLQRLSGSSEEHIDAMFGEGYLISKLVDQRGGGRPPGGGAPGGGSSGGGAPGGGSGGGAPGGGSGGGAPGGRGDEANALHTGSDGGAPTGPVEVRIDNESAGRIGSAFAEKVRPVIGSEFRKTLDDSGLAEQPPASGWSAPPELPPEPIDRKPTGPTQPPPSTPPPNSPSPPEESQ
jgi:hypothetical protein